MRDEAWGRRERGVEIRTSQLGSSFPASTTITANMHLGVITKDLRFCTSKVTLLKKGQG